MTPAILQANKRLRFARRQLSRAREAGNFQALPQLANDVKAKTSALCRLGLNYIGAEQTDCEI